MTRRLDDLFRPQQESDGESDGESDRSADAGVHGPEPQVQPTIGGLIREALGLPPDHHDLHRDR